MDNGWRVFEEHAIVLREPDKLDIHEDEEHVYGRKSIQDVNEEHINFLQERQEAQHKAEQLKNSPKAVIGWMERDEQDQKPDYSKIFPELTPSDFKKAKLDSAKLHKDISSTILSVLTRSKKIDDWLAREVLSLVGEIADEVVKDFEGYKSPPLFDYRPFQGKPIDVEFQNDKLNQK